MGSGTQELVTIIPWTFIAQILNLFIQMYLIKRFLFKPINEVLQKRRDLAAERGKGDDAGPEHHGRYGVPFLRGRSL